MTLTIAVTPWRVALVVLVLFAIAVSVWASQHDTGGYFGGVMEGLFTLVAWGAVVLWLLAGWAS